MMSLFQVPPSEGPALRFGTKLLQVNWLLVVLVSALAAVGWLVLYSAADASLDPWAGRQMYRFAFGLALMLAMAFVDVRFYLRWAYLVYLVALVLLVAVELVGLTGMGATRWLDLGIVSVQPSEMMKLGLILALARYFHDLDEADVNRLWALAPPALMIGLPTLLVLKQPDLGTALLMIAVGTVLLFVAGLALWKFFAAAAVLAACAPVAWSMLHDYQRRRVTTFLDPESDPLGAGYHILQSKIALGSGGLFGRGFLQGSQSQLNFLPEKQTDFVFTMLAEEAGLMGCLFVLLLFALVIALCYAIALRSENQFGRLVCVGVAALLFVHVFINVAMVMGLMPVVGIPLPLVSYGGSAMLTVLLGLGLVLSISVHRDMRIGNASGGPTP
ncbi:MAG: rod shape-determining protein RodA [Alphaproteobacteria bacterium]